MTSIFTIRSSTASSFDDFPFDHTLTLDAQRSLLTKRLKTLTGTCSGSVVGLESEVFFRAGYNEYTVRAVMNEYNILSQLQEYSCVPRLLKVVVMGRYTILFTELLVAKPLSKLRYDICMKTLI